MENSISYIYIYVCVCVCVGSKISERVSKKKKKYHSQVDLGLVTTIKFFLIETFVAMEYDKFYKIQCLNLFR